MSLTRPGMTEIVSFSLPEFRLAGLIQEFDGRWRAYLQEWGTSGQLLGLVGRTPQEAIDMTASALRGRIKAIREDGASSTLDLKLDLSNLLRKP